MFKGGASGRLLLLVPVVAVLICSRSSAQLLNNLAILDHETLEWFYEIGLLDKDEFDRWSELFIDSLPGDLHRPDSLQTEERMSSPERARKSEIQLDHRIHQYASDNRPYRQLTRLRVRSGSGFYCRASLEDNSGDRLHLRDRNMGWSHGGTDIRIGGLDPNWCGGLVLGRHPLFLKQRDPTISFLYPTNGRFNGIGLNTECRSFLISALSSYDRDRRFSASVHGGRLAYKRGSMVAALSTVKGHLRNRLDRKTSGVAVTGCGVGCRIGRTAACLDFALDGYRNHAFLFHAISNENDHEIYIWHYDRDFVNPFGAGRANSDTESAEIPKIGLLFRSRYVGETGLQTKARYTLSQSQRVTLESNWWETGLLRKFRFKVTFESELVARDVLKLAFLAGDDDLRRQYRSLYSALAEFRFRIDSRRSVLLSGRCRSKAAPRSAEISYQIDARIIGRSMGHDTEICLKWYDPDSKSSRDHYLYCFGKESFRVSGACRISVMISSRFGPQQTVLRKTRIEIQSTVEL